MKIVTIVGARPQFIKAAVVSRRLKEHKEIDEVILHTGQHYDKEMSDIFFEELQIPEPNYNLAIGSGLHGAQTGKMLSLIETVLLKEEPDWVLIYGDTNSTVAAALAAAKLNIKIVHVEAGLRSYNMTMPEEVNRIVSDHISTILLAPTENACLILDKEGLGSKTTFVGDVMFDSIKYYEKLARSRNTISDTIEGKFYLATLHRPNNTDIKENLIEIFRALNDLPHKVVIPMHPRTQNKIEGLHIPADNIQVIDPVGYLDMISLIDNCEKVLTDSGGLQKEAIFLGKQCITLREETEWVETCTNNWNVLVGADYNKIIDAISLQKSNLPLWGHYGDGNAGDNIIKAILEYK